jgi:hypothetical protein
MIAVDRLQPFVGGSIGEFLSGSRMSPDIALGKNPSPNHLAGAQQYRWG